MELKSADVLKVRELEFPLDRFYYRGKKSHLWVKRRDGITEVGMDAFLVHSTGYLNYISINTGEVKQGKGVGNFESAKFVSRIFSPINGKIIEVNQKALDNPRQINASPYTTWLFKIEPSNPQELEGDDFISSSIELKEWIEADLIELDGE
ncbi:glycine cleavage system H protein [archaeon]|nr:glycine cleavage system H protein [archaeon]